eukprot:TRINITY_DN31723_c0_g1_i1.p1 TRINITY_DN31723_c0_g1~~TRINITY_DN31723_c0_g1_i1.p1  ORF type:complete len:209 (-),score=19.45 TRINITY_DN31723_c0_g1_i1:133-759(-)
MLALVRTINRGARLATQRSSSLVPCRIDAGRAYASSLTPPRSSPYVAFVGGPVDPPLFPGHYDILLHDITNDLMRKDISTIFEHPYLGKASALSKKETIPVRIYGDYNRALAYGVVTLGDLSAHVFFVVDTGCPWTYLSYEALHALGVNEKERHTEIITIAGAQASALLSPVNSHFSDLCLIGGDFLRANNAVLHIDYATRRGQITFK